jgi:hypothetical protein
MRSFLLGLMPVTQPNGLTVFGPRPKVKPIVPIQRIKHESPFLRSQFQPQSSEGLRVACGFTRRPGSMICAARALTQQLGLSQWRSEPISCQNETRCSRVRFLLSVCWP